MRAIVLAARAAPKLARHYAPLFEKGKTFRYRLSVASFDYMENPDGTLRAAKRKPELSTLTCTVAQVIEFPQAVVASVTCDREIDSDYAFRPDGMWVASKAGVWRTGAASDPMPASAAELEIRVRKRATPMTGASRGCSKIRAQRGANTNG